MIKVELTPREAAVLATILVNIAGPQQSGRGNADAVLNKLNNVRDKWTDEVQHIALDWDCLNTIRFEEKRLPVDSSKTPSNTDSAREALTKRVRNGINIG